MAWKKIDDNRVRNIWVKDPDDDCECPAEEMRCSITPDFYGPNGTPICDCGQDLLYSHSEILED